MAGKLWVERELLPSFDYERYRRYVSEPLAKIVHNRNIEDLEEYFYPQLKNIYDPKLLPNIEAAVDRLVSAIKNKEKVLCYGDMDNDGITSAAILARVFDSLGATLVVKIPSRFTDGYGINPESLERLFVENEDIKLAVSVDNGIVAFSSAKYLADRKVDFIILDHHRGSENGEFPSPAIIVHPGLPGSKYKNSYLCGAGVTFKVCILLLKKYFNCDKLPQEHRDMLIDLTGLVSIGLIADVMPLTSENRALVTYGLKQLVKSKKVGIQALMNSVRYSHRLKASDISFGAAPLINAAGRLGLGRRAFDLINSDDEEEANALALELKKENVKRRKMEAELAANVFAQATAVYGEKPKEMGLVLFGESWHEGIVGIIASRVTERYQRPAIVLSVLENGTAKGSGRSALGADLKTALDQCGNIFERYGGHAAAVGLTIKTENIEEFRKKFAEVIEKQVGKGRTDTLKIDINIDIDNLNHKLMRELDLLEPFGEGNKKPIFASRVKVCGKPKTIGKDGIHFAFSVLEPSAVSRQPSGSGDGDRVLPCVVWKRIELMPEILRLFETQEEFEIAYKPEYEAFKKAVIKLVVLDVRTILKAEG